MSKKFITIAFIIPAILFSGCFSIDTGGSSTTNGNQGTNLTKSYNNNQLSFSFPADWDIIEQKDFTSDVTRETQVVVRNNLKNDTFTANVNVVKNDLQVTQSSLDYAKQILNRQKTGLLDYRETKREIIQIPVGGQATETYYTEFEARLDQTEPVTKFAQTYAVKDRSGFIIMGTYSTQENTSVIDKVTAAVKSFKVN